MFAVASRWSDDPRVLDEGKYDVPQTERPVEECKWQRAGWRFFNAGIGAWFYYSYTYEYLRSQMLIVVPLASFIQQVYLKSRAWRSVE